MLLAYNGLSRFSRYAHVFEVATGRPSFPPLSHSPGQEVWITSFSPNGRRILTASHGGDGDGKGEVRVWDAGTGQPVGQVLTRDKHIGGVCFSPDGQLVLASTHSADERDYKSELWEPSTGRIVVTTSATMNSYPFSA